MNENTRRIIQAIYWVLMAGAIVALLLLPLPVPEVPVSADQDMYPFFDDQSPTNDIYLGLDLTHTPIDDIPQS